MSKPAPPDLRSRFVEAMSRVASTVNVVTTDGPAGRHGVTVSAMSSVSADGDRPTILICVNKQSMTADPILKNGVFCVNILRDDQSYISDRFAGRHGASDKFSGVQWATQSTGAPRVSDTLVAFDCRLLSTQLMDTHYVLFGAVEDIFINQVGAPLIYSNRAYGTPLHLRSQSQKDAGQSEILKLGAFHTLGPYIVPKILDRLIATQRSVDLQIVEGDQRVIAEGLKSGAIDVALIYDWDLGADIEKERLEAFVPYALFSERHPLASRSEVSLADLSPEPLILLDAPPSEAFFLSMFKERNLDPNIRYRTRSLEMVRGMVGHGLGYSILVTKPVSELTYDGCRLKTVRLSDPLPPRHTVFAHRRDWPMTKSARYFLDACREIFLPQKAAPEQGPDRS